MKYVTIALCATCLTAPAFGQTTTATGTGVGISQSSSQAGAVAIGGGNAQGGNARSRSNSSGNTVNIAANPANTRQEVTGTQTLKNVPTAFAPSLAAAGLETCLGSVSGGGSFVGTGFSFGGTIPDPGCAARLDARTLWSFGLKKAAIARLCLRDDIYQSMPEVCSHYLPPPPGSAVVPVALPRTAYMSKEPVLLIDGNSGRERLCNDYNEAGQKCRVWAHSAPALNPTPKKKVAARKPVPLPKMITDPNGSPKSETPLGPPL